MNWNKEIEKISRWMADYNKNAGTNGYICGISGGIDSALAGSLCVKECEGKVIFINLPCQSSLDMEEDALKLANNLGVELRVFNLIDSYNAIIKELEAGGETVENITRENTKSRLRMTYLFAIANQYNMLVCGTGNRSELQIGFVSVGGDQICSIEPLGNYYKNEIYKMAELITEIPKNILEKTPTPDLSQNKNMTDEQIIGLSYKKIDGILKAINEKNNNTLKSFSKKDVEKIKSMIKKAKFKNEVPPRYIREKE